MTYRYIPPPQHEFDQAQLARRKAEAAKRKSDEMLARELLLKKECEAATREVRPGTYPTRWFGDGGILATRALLLKEPVRGADVMRWWWCCY